MTPHQLSQLRKASTQTKSLILPAKLMENKKTKKNQSKNPPSKLKKMMTRMKWKTTSPYLM
jgi:hypothetical protein